MTGPTVTKNFIHQVFLLPKLIVPYYQRPYTWEADHVLQLLDDINEGYHKTQPSIYRIGTVILHQDVEGQLNIVDGQQRLITLSLILFALNDRLSPLLSCKFRHDASQRHIAANFRTIQNWFREHPGIDSTLLAAYILECCELVVIRLYDLSEAFQFFDSQNSRGRPLQPYDLLKAFHLREMLHCDNEVKRACVRDWEKAIDEKLLGKIIGHMIFRIRKWVKGEDARSFTIKDIREFKGLNLDVTKLDYPYVRPYLLSRPQNASGDYPYQLTQLVLNGLHFFGMVAHYTNLYKSLFEDNPSGEYIFYKANTGYTGAHRNGDNYVKEMFQALVMLYRDRFGAEGFAAIYEDLFLWSYRLRLEKTAVRYTSVDAFIAIPGNNVFKQMAHTWDHEHLYYIRQKAMLREVKRPIAELQKLYADRHLIAITS